MSSPWSWSWTIQVWLDSKPLFIWALLRRDFTSWGILFPTSKTQKLEESRPWWRLHCKGGNISYHFGLLQKRGYTVHLAPSFQNLCSHVSISVLMQWAVPEHLCCSTHYQTLNASHWWSQTCLCLIGPGHLVYPFGVLGHPLQRTLLCNVVLQRRRAFIKSCIIAISDFWVYTLALLQAVDICVGLCVCICHGCTWWRPMHRHAFFSNNWERKMNSLLLIVPHAAAIFTDVVDMNRKSLLSWACFLHVNNNSWSRPQRQSLMAAGSVGLQRHASLMGWTPPARGHHVAAGWPPPWPVQQLAWKMQDPPAQNLSA